MATKPTNKPDEQTTADPVFDKSELLKSAALFGCSPEILAGALVMVGKDKFTRQEAKEAVTAFIKRPVGKE